MILFVFFLFICLKIKSMHIYIYESVEKNVSAMRIGTLLFTCVHVWVLSHSVVSDSLQPHGL